MSDFLSLLFPRPWTSWAGWIWTEGWRPRLADGGPGPPHQPAWGAGVSWMPPAVTSGCLFVRTRHLQASTQRRRTLPKPPTALTSWRLSSRKVCGHCPHRSRICWEQRRLSGPRFRQGAAGIPDAPFPGARDPLARLQVPKMHTHTPSCPSRCSRAGAGRGREVLN